MQFLSDPFLQIAPKATIGKNLAHLREQVGLLLQLVQELIPRMTVMRYRQRPL